MASTFALIVAAGRGFRFGGSLPKQYLGLGGTTVLRHAAAAFATHPRIDGVLVAIRPEDRNLFDQAMSGLSLLPAVPGGAERQDSVRLGLEALAARQPDRVLIHDGARPFPDAALIDRVIDGLDQASAAIPALPLGDTIKRAADGRVLETIDRSQLWRAQTPQGFHFDAILAAHRQMAGRMLTDDAAVAEAAGIAPLIVMGSEENLKVTTAEDLAAAERLLAVRQADSDADVGLHALTDAVLGAIGAGDIGMHFPPSDPRWRGASSDRFLAYAATLVRERGGAIAAVDVTIICERPKIAPYRDRMIERVAEILEISPGRVSIKATTTERLGFTGRGEGIAAQAVATIRLPL
jgi:2-C-methyl-D-erythritol 4-phosphate cytidylyltransferase/2-C-methyl-D-erythritol 2,4-cyclodiphosphate synthase